MVFPTDQDTAAKFFRTISSHGKRPDPASKASLHTTRVRSAVMTPLRKQREEKAAQSYFQHLARFVLDFFSQIRKHGTWLKRIMYMYLLRVLHTTCVCVTLFIVDSEIHYTLHTCVGTHTHPRSHARTHTCTHAHTHTHLPSFLRFCCRLTVMLPPSTGGEQS